MAGTSDSVLWRREWMRQFHSVKAALHSLRKQTDQRRTCTPSKAVREMAHWFALVDEAFEVLNRPEPQPQPTSEEFLPGPQGRREFLADLKGDDR